MQHCVIFRGQKDILGISLDHFMRCTSTTGRPILSRQETPALLIFLSTLSWNHSMFISMNNLTITIPFWAYYANINTVVNGLSVSDCWTNFLGRRGLVKPI